jgi:predicted 3-demethylubiquinone-9 3-methyltransferase (glyoxalase superfamily)
MNMLMQKITPCLWFDMNCEEAINYYVSVFNDSPNKTGESKIVSIQRYEEGMETPENEKMLGKVLTAIFELNGQRFMALDGGPIFKFNEAISFEIECKDQAEVDYFWEKLSAVPESEQCGWVKDKFGLSWQIIPKRLSELLADSDKEKAHRVMNAMLEMKKISVPDLEKAYRGE